MIKSHDEVSSCGNENPRIIASVKDLTFLPCTPNDIDQLISIGTETYFETFAAMNQPEIMADYLEAAFNHERIEAELLNPDSLFLFIFLGEQLAGYLKTNTGLAQTDLREPFGLEIERIYVRQQFQHQGLGKAMIAKGIEIARRQGKTYVWLGVWEHNSAAIAFYQRMGFIQIGTHDFIMGTDRQTDYIMKMELDPEGYGDLQDL